MVLTGSEEHEVHIFEHFSHAKMECSPWEVRHIRILAFIIIITCFFPSQFHGYYLEILVTTNLKVVFLCFGFASQTFFLVYRLQNILIVASDIRYMTGN